MSEKSEKKRVTFSAEPDEGPDDAPLPAPGPINAVGVETQAPPPEPLDSLAQADALIADIARAQNPRGLAEVKWVQFIQPARMSGKSGTVGAISSTATSKLLFDHEQHVIVVVQHGTLVPLSNVAAFGLVAPPA